MNGCAHLGAQVITLVRGPSGPLVCSRRRRRAEGSKLRGWARICDWILPHVGTFLIQIQAPPIPSSLSAIIDVSGNLTCRGTITPTVPVKGGAGKVVLYGVQAAEN